MEYRKQGKHKYWQLLELPIIKEQYLLCTNHRNNGTVKHYTLGFTDNNQFLKEFCGIEFKKVMSGVYMIGDFYIGRSNNIRARLMSHLRSAINNRHPNKEVESKIISRLLKRKVIPMWVLSDNDKDECKLIGYYKYHGFPLVNKDMRGVTVENLH